MTKDKPGFLDFEKIDILLEGFNQSTGFVTAILDLKGKILSKSGWRKICTDFHRINHETSKRCTISDTVLANKTSKGGDFHYYKCLNGLIDIAAPIVVNGKHVANLFSGQFFFEKPDLEFFSQQAEKYKFDKKAYLEALNKVPVISEEKAKTIMTFLVNMTRMMGETTLQRMEQVELNHALKKSEERFRTLVEQAGDAMFLTDLNGKILTTNEYACTSLGYSRHELLQLNVSDVDVNFADPKLQKELWDQLIPGKPKTLFTSHKRKDGTQFPVEIRLGLIDYDGKNAIVGFARDISMREKAKEALQESEAKFKLLMQQSPFIVEIYNMDGLQISVNKAYEEMWNISAQATINKFNILLSKEVQNSNLMNYVKRAYAGESVTVPEYKFKMTTKPGTRFSGKERWFSTRIYPLKKESGEVKNIVITHQDISERKQAETELQNHKNHLEELVAERTRELETKNKELDNALKVFVGRELTIRNLENKIKAMEG